MLFSNQSEDYHEGICDLSDKQINKPQLCNYEKVIFNKIDDLLNHLANFESTLNRKRVDISDLELCATFLAKNIMRSPLEP
jgi:hypothetical protein